MQEATWAPPPVAGSVTDGVFTDHTSRFSVPVPPGFRAEPAALNDQTRVVFIDPSGDIRIRVSLAADTAERADCDWTFTDDAANVIGRLGAVRIATCTPHDADAPRIFAWLAPTSNPPLRIEADVAQGHLARADEAVALVLDGVITR